MRVLGRATSRTCASRRSCRARARCSTRCSSRSRTLQRLHERADGARGRAAPRATPATLARYGELQERYQREGGYELEARVKALTADVGFAERDLARAVDTLSGGERGRLELAKVLRAEPDLLLLDEPTNHLDVAAIEHLESFLAEYPGAFVLVSHDRAFLRAVCREIVEVEDGQVRPLPVRLRQVRRRARRAARARARRLRAAEGARSTRPRTSSAATSPGRRPSRPRAGARCWRSSSGWSAPTTSGSTPARSGSRFQTGGDPGGKETIRAPRLDGRLRRTRRASCATSPQHLPRRQGRHRRAERLRQVDAAEDAASASCRRSRGKVERGTSVRIGYFDQKLGDARRGALADRRDPHRARRLSPEDVVRSTWRASASPATTRSARSRACRAASAAGWRWRR